MSKLSARNASKLSAFFASRLSAFGLGVETFFEAYDDDIVMLFDIEAIHYNVTTDTILSSIITPTLLLGNRFFQTHAINWSGPDQSNTRQVGIGWPAFPFTGTPIAATDTVAINNLTVPSNLSASDFAWNGWPAIDARAEEPFFETFASTMKFRGESVQQVVPGQGIVSSVDGVFHYGPPTTITVDFATREALDWIMWYIQGLGGFSLNDGVPGGQDLIQLLLRIELDITA